MRSKDATIPAGYDRIEIRGTLTQIRVDGLGEFPPSYLAVYLDSAFVREPLVLVSADAQPGSCAFSISGLYPTNRDIPRDARLAFQSYVSVRNDYGATCISDTGATSLELFDIQNTLKTGDTASFKQVLAMQTTPQHDVKGTLHITIDSISRCHGGGGSKQQLKGPLTFDASTCLNMVANFNTAMGQVQSYLTNLITFTKQFQPMIANVEQINCPFYPGNVTFAGSTTGLLMPMPAYLMYEVPKSDYRWWMQQLEILASRQDFASLDSFTSQFTNLPLEKQCAYTMMLMGQYVQTLEYVSDKTSGRSIELFGDALFMRSGDCEDLACAIKQMQSSFALSTPAHATLRTMLTLARQYTFLFCLEGVSATHTQNETDFKDGVGGAHAAVKALPNDYFGECIARSDPTHALAQLTTADEFKGKLPVLVGEGTGMLFPIGEVTGSEHLRKVIGERVEDLKVIKKYLYNAPTSSKFYKQIMVGATLDYASKYRTASFFFTTKEIDAQGKEVLAKGVPFSLLVQRSPNVVIQPAGFNAPIRVAQRIAGGVYDGQQCNYAPEFTPEQMALMQSVTRTRVPPPVFKPVNTAEVGPVIDTNHDRIAHPVLDNIVAAIKAMAPNTITNYHINVLGPAKEASMRIGGNNNNGTQFIRAGNTDIPTISAHVKAVKLHYFINPQYLTREFQNGVIKSFQSLMIATDASYLLERHLDDHHIYRLTVEFLDSHYGEHTDAKKPSSSATTTHLGDAFHHYQHHATFASYVTEHTFANHYT